MASAASLFVDIEHAFLQIGFFVLITSWVVSFAWTCLVCVSSEYSRGRSAHHGEAQSKEGRATRRVDPGG